MLEARVEQLACERLGRLPHRFDRSRGERGRDELADPRVIGRLDEEKAPPLDLPERRPTRVERLGVELALAAHVAKVATEPPVTQARAHLGMAGDEVTAQALVEVHRRRLAQEPERRVGIGDEGRVGRVEAGRRRVDAGTLDAVPARIDERLACGACETRRRDRRSARAAGRALGRL